jgi:DHA2 family multidrug resistance protein-like MFS transporter
VPPARAGVATAMNTVSRMVAGALGAAVTGSLLFTVYGSRMGGAVAALSPDLAAAARDSVGAATQIAASLPGAAGTALAEAAGAAFVDAIGLASLVGSTIALGGAVLILRFMPPAHLPQDQEVEPATGLVPGDAAAEG